MSYKLIKKNLSNLPFIKQSKNSLQMLFPKFFLPSKEFYKWYQFINNSQKWNEDKLKEYQWNKLKEMLAYCYQNIPYYQKLFRNIGAVPHDFTTEEEFRKIPFLTKELIRENIEELLPFNIKRNKIIKYNTGGSTGIPLPIYKSDIDDVIEDAFMCNQWARIGYKPKDSRVIIRGEVIEKNNLWKHYPLTNSWVFSSYHLSNSYIKTMVDKLNKIQPLFLHVYPSSLWVFANLIKNNNLKLNFKPKAILCGSEKLFDHQRELFNEVFGCRSYSWLGLAEQTILAGECEYSTDLHIFPQHSYVELIDNKGNVISEHGISGQIVGTNLHRYTFPLIRYISGDVAKYNNNSCKCGLQYKKFEQIEGRIQNMIVSQDGRIIPLTALVFGQHLKAFNKIEKMQLFQDKPGEVQIILIKGLNFTAQDESVLIEQLSSATNYTVQFMVSYSRELERTTTGKHKFLIQKLDVGFYDFNQNTKE